MEEKLTTSNINFIKFFEKDIYVKLYDLLNYYDLEQSFFKEFSIYDINKLFTDSKILYNFINLIKSHPKTNFSEILQNCPVYFRFPPRPAKPSWLINGISADDELTDEEQEQWNFTEEQCQQEYYYHAYNELYNKFKAANNYTDEVDINIIGMTTFVTTSLNFVINSWCNKSYINNSEQYNSIIRDLSYFIQPKECFHETWYTLSFSVLPNTALVLRKHLTGNEYSIFDSMFGYSNKESFNNIPVKCTITKNNKNWLNFINQYKNSNNIEINELCRCIINSDFIKEK